MPIDDEHTICYAWANFGDRGDPPEWNTPEGPELIEQGEVFDRPYHQKQRFPADVEAVEGMGPVTIHQNETLAPSDKGIALMRRALRQQIREVTSGADPIRVTDLRRNPVPTYGGDSVLKLPQQELDEANYLSELAHELMEAQYRVDDLEEHERITYVTGIMQAIERRNSNEG